MIEKQSWRGVAFFARCDQVVQIVHKDTEAVSAVQI